MVLNIVIIFKSLFFMFILNSDDVMIKRQIVTYDATNEFNMRRVRSKISSFSKKILRKSNFSKLEVYLFNGLRIVLLVFYGK
jgi:hypothetical protein